MFGLLFFIRNAPFGKHPGISRQQVSNQLLTFALKPILTLLPPWATQIDSAKKWSPRSDVAVKGGLWSGFSCLHPSFMFVTCPCISSVCCACSCVYLCWCVWNELVSVLFGWLFVLYVAYPAWPSCLLLFNYFGTLFRWNIKSETCRRRQF